MKAKLILFAICTIVFLSGCNQSTKNNNPNEQNIVKPENLISGKWVRIGHTGPVSFDFKENGSIEADFGNNQTVEVISSYELSGDTITFMDKEGQMCQGDGKYKVYQTDYYVSFDLIEDDCSGRINTTMGFWTRPDFNDLLKTLEDKLSASPEPELYLTRARIYLATGKSKLAKKDFDKYLLTDTLNPRVYVNRAGTRFPNDLKGVVSDCNQAIALDPKNKNAYFLRGLARYELGEKEQACADFSKAIELGFSILKIAEQEKCAEYWNE